MRKDFAKILVERPRTGGGVKQPKGWGKKTRGRGEDRDDLPSQESIRRKWVASNTQKSLNENLRPLERFLGKHVGRPWDRVFSEICSNLRVDNTVQKHVRDHLPEFVAVTCRRAGNKVYGRFARLGSELSHGHLYVDPDTGILCRYELQRPTRKVEQTSIAIDARTQLHKLEGIWYVVTLARTAGRVYVELTGHVVRSLGRHRLERMLLPPGQADLFEAGQVCFIHERTGAMRSWLDDPEARGEYLVAKLLRSEALAKRYGDARVFGVSRKQAPSKLLKRFGVRNDPQT